MGRKRVATSVLVDPEVKTRLEALAIVRREKQSEVCRQLLEDQLPAMEGPHRRELRELRETAKAMGLELEVLTMRMVKDGLALEAVRGLQVYPGYPARVGHDAPPLATAALNAAERRRLKLESALHAETVPQEAPTA